MSIKKQYPKRVRVCKVTFDVPEQVGSNFQTAYIVGEFNGWSKSATPMKRKKNGAFSATVDLQRGREYQFRYLFDDNKWENDEEADKLAETPFVNTFNSVIVI
jgi:1,4-alpha-glucan branching enzyme